MLINYIHTQYTEQYQSATATDCFLLATWLMHSSRSIQQSTYSEAQKKYHYYKIFKEFRKKYIDLNRNFRKFFCGDNPDNTTHNLFALSYRHQNLTKMIQEELHAVPMNTKNHHPKFNFSLDLAFSIWNLECAILFAIYRDNLIHQYQLAIAMCRILIDFFEPESVLWDKIIEIYSGYIRNIQFDDISPYIEKLIADDQTKRTRMVGIEYDSKSKKVTVEEIEQLRLSGMNQTQIKEYLSVKYNCSQATVQRVMRNAGLSRRYNRKR